LEEKSMSYRVLLVTDRSDLPETELFIGLKRAGVDITVACNPTGRYFDRLIAADVPVVDLTLKSRFTIKGIKALNRILNQSRYDIIYCFNNKAASNAILAIHGRRIRMITYRGTVGNVSFLSPASWTTHLNPRVNRIVCVSRAVRDYLLGIRFCGLRLAKKRVVTIYKGHDIEWYQHSPADLSEFNLPEDAFVVGFAGRNRPHKGIGILVDSARWLPPDTQVHFLLMGHLTQDKELRRQIAASPLRDNIHLTGFRTDAPAVTAACDAFVMPSTKREGLSRAVIEAMAYRTVPVVTDVGGLPELVVDRQCGFVVPPNDSRAIADVIVEMIRDPSLKKQLGENAREHIRSRFNITQTISDTKNLFEDLMHSA
jgi:glycosyltransferase involved in cell wall biosynthesis